MLALHFLSTNIKTMDLLNDKTHNAFAPMEWDVSHGMNLYETNLNCISSNIDLAPTLMCHNWKEALGLLGHVSLTDATGDQIWSIATRPGLILAFADDHDRDRDFPVWASRLLLTIVHPRGGGASAWLTFPVPSAHLIPVNLLPRECVSILLLLTIVTLH